MERKRSRLKATQISPELHNIFPPKEPPVHLYNRKTIFATMSEEAKRAVYETKELEECSEKAALAKSCQPTTIDEKIADSQLIDKEMSLPECKSQEVPGTNEQVPLESPTQKDALDTRSIADSSSSATVTEKKSSITSEDTAKGHKSHVTQNLTLKSSPEALQTAQVPQKPMNVFERLTNTQPVYRITARQRSKARVALSMKVDNLLLSKAGQIRRSTTPLLNTKLPITRTTPVNSIYRSRTPSTLPVGKSLTSLPDTRTKTPPINAASRPVRSRTSMDGVREDKSDFYLAPLIVPEIETQNFEITPIGYDSRYLTLRYESPLENLYEDDEEAREIINRSKMKCRQWLMKQLNLISPANS